MILGFRERHRTSLGTGHQQVTLQSQFRQATAEPPQISCRTAANECVDNRCGGSLVFAALARHAVRQGHLADKAGIAQNLFDLQLVRGIGIGIDEGHRHARDPLLAEGFDRIPEVAGGKGRQDMSIGPDAFTHRQTQPARNERRGRFPEQIVHFVAITAPDFKDVPKSFRGKQTDDLSSALQERIQSDRRSVQEVFRRLDQLFWNGLGNGLDDAFVQAFGCREYLGEMHSSALIIVGNQVGIGASNIDANRCCHPSLKNLGGTRNSVGQPV